MKYKVEEMHPKAIERIESDLKYIGEVADNCQNFNDVLNLIDELPEIYEAHADVWWSWVDLTVKGTASDLPIIMKAFRKIRFVSTLTEIGSSSIVVKLQRKLVKGYDDKFRIKLTLNPGASCKRVLDGYKQVPIYKVVCGESEETSDVN